LVALFAAFRDQGANIALGVAEVYRFIVIPFIPGVFAARFSAIMEFYALSAGFGCGGGFGAGLGTKRE